MWTKPVYEKIDGVGTQGYVPWEPSGQVACDHIACCQ